jgi:hypothetical protein
MVSGFSHGFIEKIRGNPNQHGLNHIMTKQMDKNTCKRTECCFQVKVAPGEQQVSETLIVPALYRSLVASSATTDSVVCP